MNPVLDDIAPRARRRLAEFEHRRRQSGEWGEWQRIEFPPGSAGSGWAGTFTTAHRNQVFCVLDRTLSCGVRHLMISSLSAIRPTWHEAQRIKDELAGEDATAVEVYPPRHEIVDEADAYHLWVLTERLPFGLTEYKRSVA